MKFPYINVNQITPGMSGFYRIAHAAYHAGPGISSTKVKKAVQSFAAFANAEPMQSAALTFGRAFHAAILEPDLFAKFEQIPGGPTTKAYKEAVAQGRDAVCESDLEIIPEMVSAIKAHPDYAALPGYDAEVMAVKTCSETGLLLKCKADLFGSKIVDFKTTSYGVSKAEFLNTCVNFGYHISAAFYQDIIFQLVGARLPFIMVPVTKAAPFECEFYELSPEILDEGRKLYKAGLRRIAMWANMQPEEAARDGKTTKILYPSTRMLYSTKEQLEFIAGM